MKKHESKTAWSTAHAWAIADELFPGDYARDDNSSDRAGYPIYRATSEDSRAYICDLNTGLEINYDDGSSQWISINSEALRAEHQQAEQAEALAREIEKREAAEVAAHVAAIGKNTAEKELEDAQEALADMEAEAQKLAAEVMRLKARLFDLMEAHRSTKAAAPPCWPPGTT